MRVLRADMMLADRYRLRRLLGSGGMSRVWQAYDRVLERQVAIKVLATARAGEPEFRQRVRAEARAAAQLVHPHVVGVFDYAETTGPDGTVLPFVVMELVDGQSLEQRLATGPLPWPLAVRIATQVADALAMAHEHGVVHRDVTAGNVILTDAGAKVVDFGISAAIGDPDGEPGAATLTGTPAYLAPERLTGLPVAPSADVYSLGVLLHTMLAGTTPFDGADAAAVTHAHWYRAPAPLPPIPGLPPEVDRLRRRCLAKRARDRPTAADLAAALDAVPLPHAEEPLPVPAAGAPPQSPTGQATTAALPIEPPPPNRRRRVLVAGLVVLAILAGAAGLFTLERGTGTPSDSAGQPPVAVASRTGTDLPSSVHSPAGTPSRSGGPSPAPDPTATERASPTAPASHARHSATAAAPYCTVAWHVSDDWGTGFEASIRLHIDRPPASWTMTFSFPGDQQITSGWGGSFRQQGHRVTVTSQDWNSGGRYPLGLDATYRTSNPPPTAFAVNGTGCSMQ